LSESAPTEVKLPPEPDAEAELARKNNLWGWSLLGLFVVLFAGTAGVAFIYLWLS
jgi:hypothetical protein